VLKVSSLLSWVLLSSGLIVKILQGKVIKSGVDYLAKGGKNDRGKKTLVRRLTGCCRRYLVHRLAVHNRLCRAGLVEDFAGHNNLAILSGRGAGLSPIGGLVAEPPAILGLR
jgi:hypothetical protein